MMILMIKKLAPLCALLMLSACGFHLKGAGTYTELPVQNWQISGGALQQPLENAMQHVLGKRLIFSGSPEAEIRVLSVDTKKDIYTITRAARINEYLFSMRVYAQAYRDGKAWGEPMQIDIKRTLPYSDREVLGKAEEESTIWREMQNDASEQIVRRLAFLPTYPSTTAEP
jgi:hypothetical protein